MASTGNDERALEALERREKRNAGRKALARFVTRATPESQQTTRQASPDAPGDAPKRNPPVAIGDCANDPR